MRGQRKLFDLFGESPNVQKETEARNQFLHLRDEVLCHRFYWHADANKLKFQEVLNQLNNEFYLSDRRIIDILDKQYHLLSKIQKSKPTQKELQAKYPHLTWNIRK